MVTKSLDQISANPLHKNVVGDIGGTVGMNKKNNDVRLKANPRDNNSNTTPLSSLISPNTKTSSNLTLIVRLPKCLDIEEKNWVKTQVRHDREKKTIARTKPVFHFEHEGFEVNINEGNTIGSDHDDDDGDDDGDDETDFGAEVKQFLNPLYAKDNQNIGPKRNYYEYDDDKTMYDFWNLYDPWESRNDDNDGVVEIDLGKIKIKDNTQRDSLLTSLFSDQNDPEDEFSDGKGLSNKNTTNSKYNDITDSFIYLQKRNAKRALGNKRSIYSSCYVKLQAEPICIDKDTYLELEQMNKMRNNKNINIQNAEKSKHLIFEINPNLKAFVHSLEVFPQIEPGNNPNTNNQDDITPLQPEEELYPWTAQILSMNEIRTVLELDEKITNNKKQFEKFNQGDDDTGLNIPDLNYLGILDFFELSPKLLYFLTQTVPKSALYGLHQDIKDYSLLVQQQKLQKSDHKIQSNLEHNTPNKILPLSAHFKDDYEAKTQNEELQFDDDGFDDDGAVNDLSDDGLDVDLLYQILLETQKELRDAGAFEQEEFEEEVSKLGFF
jgi:hypothetical protein